MATAVRTSKQTMSLQEVLARGGPSRGTLLRWSANGCPFLAGRKLYIGRQKFAGAKGVPRLFFLADEIEAILAEFAKPVFKGELIEHDRTVWLTLTRAWRTMRSPPMLLKKYGGKPCPLLDGRVLKTQTVDVVEYDSMGKRYFRQRVVYSKADLQLVQRGPQIDDKWARISECGHHLEQIRKWEISCPHLGGRGLKVKEFWTLIELPAITTLQNVKRKPSITIKRVKYALVEDIEAIDRVRHPQAADLDPNWMTCAAAAVEFQLKEGSIYHWGRFECSLLGGRCILTKRARLPDGRAFRWMITYLRSDIELVAKRLRNRPRTIHTDADGEWLSGSAAIERFPNVSATDLRDWHRRGDWLRRLPADWRLRAKQVPITEGAWRMNPIVWVYFVPDIITGIAARNGEVSHEEVHQPQQASTAAARAGTLTVDTIITREFHAEQFGAGAKNIPVPHEHGKPKRLAGFDPHCVPARNGQFKLWYEDKSLITYHSYSTIRDTWNELFMEATISDGKQGIDTVKKGISSATKKATSTGAI